ncbi:MAG: hypothetical protein MUD01_01735 [Chloroflexaceae bacterium]|jgi:hypothetical protein|nr:hypothetical protein [Chloroflexaceae bacterium]
MRSVRTILHALFALLVLVSLVGCGGQAATMSAIPIFPNTVPLQAGESKMADLFANTLTRMVGEKLKADVRMYSLPPKSSWDSINAFYAEQLNGTDWKSNSQLAQQNAAISIAGWTRGGFASEQVLMVGRGSDPLNGQAFLIVALFSE